MDAITNLIPVPMPLPIAAAGITVQVAELTLRDLADLQAFLDASRPDPLLDAEAALSDAEGEARRVILARAYAQTDEEVRGVYGEPSGRPYFATLEGMAALVWVALRRHQPHLTPEGAVALASQMSEGELGRLSRIAHGHATRKTIERLLSPFLRPSVAVGVSTWGQAIEEVIEAHPGWRYPDVYDLTISEFLNARRRGKPVEDGVPVPAGMDPLEALARFREAFAVPAGSGEDSPQDHGSDDEARPAQPDGE